MTLADRHDIDLKAQEYDRRIGYDWGRRGLPASLWLSGQRPAGFDDACRDGQLAWARHHSCPECNTPISTERQAVLHWRERHAPIRRTRRAVAPGP
jgi:hypothetical protein